MFKKKKTKLEKRSLSKEKTGQASYVYQSKSISSACREHPVILWGGNQLVMSDMSKAWESVGL